MKNSFMHMFLSILICILFMPILTYADCSPDEWKNDIPQDPYRSTYKLNKRTAIISCEYPNAIGSCKYDGKQEINVNSSDPISFDIREYIGDSTLKIRAIFYNAIEYNAQGAFSSSADYSVCTEGKKDNKQYCYKIDESQAVILKAEKDNKQYLGYINLYEGYKPLEFEEKDFISKIEDSGSCPNVWKKCERGWSKFYLSDPGDDSTLLDKQSFIKKYDFGADLVQSTCASLFGSPKDKNAPAYFLSFAFRVVRFVSIILLIVLSALDFLQSTTSQDSEEIKKAFTKTMKRLVLCILIFVLPILLEFVLSIVNENEVDLCISTSNEASVVAIDDSNEE